MVLLGEALALTDQELELSYLDQMNALMCCQLMEKRLASMRGRAMAAQARGMCG
jgi:hypothetical protein